MTQKNQADTNNDTNDDLLTIAGVTYGSRLLVGSGKYRDLAQTREATDAAGADIITVAIRRVNIGQDPSAPNLLDVLPLDRFTILPNTAGCYNALDAVYTLQMARELLGGRNLVKLEVLGDEKTLFPHMPETLKAAEILVRDGFDVMVYCSDDPIQAKILEQIGCVAVMPLASLIGSGMGIVNPWNLSLIIEQATVPVLVDAGVGTASDAAIAMELGCDGVLMNSAIACAHDPLRMARAMRLAVQAGREAYLAGRMPKRMMAVPSSPMAGRMVAPLEKLVEKSAEKSAASVVAVSATSSSLVSTVSAIR
jgi:thiazole synthase